MVTKCQNHVILDWFGIDLVSFSLNPWSWMSHLCPKCVKKRQNNENTKITKISIFSWFGTIFTWSFSRAFPYVLWHICSNRVSQKTQNHEKCQKSMKKWFLSLLTQMESMETWFGHVWHQIYGICQCSEHVLRVIFWWNIVQNTKIGQNSLLTYLRPQNTDETRYNGSHLCQKCHDFGPKSSKWHFRDIWCSWRTCEITESLL